MDETSAESSDYIQVKGSLSGLLTTTNTLSGDGLTLTIDPSNDFIPGEIITVRIGQILDFTQTTGLQHPTVYQFRVETNGSGVGYFSSSDKFTGSIGDNGANMTYMADIDGDGDLDAIVVTRTASDLKFYVLYKQNGSDSYLTPDLSRTVDIADSSDPQGATFNDIDNDGDLDFILFVSPGANTRSFYVYTNDGFGSFSSSSSSFHSDLPTTDIGQGVFTDYDRDGLDELFMTADNVYGLWPFENDGTGGPGSFTEGSSVGQFGSIAGRFAVSRDFNNDDYPDIAIIKKINFSSTATNDSLGVLLSDGAGGFTSHTYNVGKVGASFVGAWGMDAGDFDGDGYIDLAFVTNDSLFVLDNNQNGTFAAQRSFNKNFSVGDVRAADMDSDGDLDIVILGSYTSIIYNDGSGDFGTPFGFSRGYSGIVPDISDADGDGDLDMIYSVNGTMTVMTNEAVTAPSSNPTSFYIESNQGTSLGLRISGGTSGTKNLVLMKQGSAVDATPTDDVIYTANSTFGSGSEVGTGNYVVYGGSGSTFTVDGLDPDQTYHFQVFKFNSAGASAKYQLTSAPTTSGTTRTAPTGIVSDLTTNELSTSMTLSWSASGSSIGQNRIVLVKQGSAVDAIPTDSTSYTADASFGNGDQLGIGNYLVYDGSDESVTITGLTAETTYHFAIFEYDGTSGAQRFYTVESATASATTKPTPTIWSKNDSTLTFTKADYADWTLAVNQDRISDNLWLTRQDDSGLFNYADETGWNGSVSPSGTMWALGTTDNLASLTFDTFRNTLDGSIGDNIVGTDMVAYIESDNLYLDINFSSWTQSAEGGGFSYTRSKGPEPAPIIQSFQDSAGYAVQFDGGNMQDEYIEIYVEDYEIVSEFSVEMWVKPDTINLDQVFLSLGRDDLFIGVNSSNQFYATHTEPNVGGGGGEGECCFFKGVSATSSSSGASYSSAEIDGSGTTITATAGEWYHVALTGQSGGYLTLYINGVEQDTASIEDVAIDNSYWVVGSDEDRIKNFFGTVDELRIWKSVRTESQIRSFMHRTYSGPVGRLTGYWQFNEGSGGYTYDGLNNHEGQFYDAYEDTWVTSDAPIGQGSVDESTDFQTGTAAIGNASLSMADGFDNPVDVQVTEVTTEPNQFPSGFTSGVGGKYFVINLFGDPGTFSADLTLTYGPGVVTSTQENNPDLLKLYKRSSNSTGAWTEIASATSALAATGVVSWSGITSFSQFIAVAEEYVPPTVDIQIANGTNVVAYTDSAFTFTSSFFELADGFADSALTISAKSSVSGILYLDQDENGTYDSGTDNQLGADAEFSYTPSGSVKLMYQGLFAGVDTLTIKLQSSTASDSVQLDFLTVEASPTLQGNADENGWHLISNPMNSTVGTLLSNVWIQGAINSNAPTGDATLFRFIQDSARYVAITTDLDTTKLDEGEGLLAYIYEDDDILDGQDDVDGGWPKTLTNYGVPFGESSDITIKNVDYDGVSGTSGSEGFALLGNPFGWSLSADSVIATIKREDELANSYVYRWDPVNKTFKITSNGSIEAYESVFVRLIESGSTADLSFDYNDAITGPAKKKQEEKLEFNLVHSQSGVVTTSSVRFDENGDAGIDPYDGYYLGSYATEFANLYSAIEDQPLTINNLPKGLAEVIEVPVYLDASVSGEFQLNWDHEQIPEGWTFELEDLKTGTIVNLADQESYGFSAGNIQKQSSFRVPTSLYTFKDHSKGNKSKSDVTKEPLFILTVTSSTAVSNENELGIPEEVELYQNYPNPFNPTSVIRFGVPEASIVKLEVFDVLGRKVATLLNNETKRSGRYNVQFNARTLSSGMYIYRLQVGDKVLIKKMTLIK